MTFSSGGCSSPFRGIQDVVGDRGIVEIDGPGAAGQSLVPGGQFQRRLYLRKGSADLASETVIQWRPVAQCLLQVLGVHSLLPVQIGNGAGDAQRPV